MTIYHLTAYSLSLFLLCVTLLATSYSPEQSTLIDDGSDEAFDKLKLTHTRYQNMLTVIGTLSFLFTVVHGTIAAAKLLAGLM